jgi:hypothetical protein
MNDLIHSCASALDQAVTPSCGTNYGERITTVILSKTKVSCAGNVPTAAEFSTSYSSIVIYKNIVRGHRITKGATEIQWNVTERYDKEYRVEGRIRRLSGSLVRTTEKLDRYPNLYMYYITDKNYCFGPYNATSNFDLIELEGKGVPPYLKFWFDFVGNGIDYSNYDSNYNNITGDNITADSTTITVDSTTITVDNT